MDVEISDIVGSAMMAIEQSMAQRGGGGGAVGRCVCGCGHGGGGDGSPDRISAAEVENGAGRGVEGGGVTKTCAYNEGTGHAHAACLPKVSLPIDRHS